jgi:hypothetical protein
MSSTAANATQNHAHPLSPPTVQRTAYSSVANGRKTSPSSGKIQVSNAAST